MGATSLLGASVFLLVIQPSIAQTETSGVVPPTDDQSVLELNDQISERRQKIEELDHQVEVYEQTIRAKEKEVTSLTTELSKIDTQVAETNVDLETTSLHIEKIELEIRLLQQQLREKEIQIGWQRERLSDFLRRLYRQRQRSMLEVAVVEENFSDFFSSVQHLTQMQDELRTNLDQLSVLRHDLQVLQEDLLGKRVNLLQKKERLDLLKRSLDEQKDFKSQLMVQTQSTQEKFENLLDNIRSESDSVNAEIATLEKRVREKLGQEGEGSADGKLGKGPLQWPIEATKGISAFFRDPTYPFRCTQKSQKNCIGEHAGVDIRTPQGTPVAAAADGYVAIARRLDWVRNAEGKILRPAYNYVTLIHADGISTVYGHLSSVKVVEDTYVKKGDIIGLSGALPGTAGAGSWTTGAHLHFEVRKEGIPTDPLNYLP